MHDFIQLAAYLEIQLCDVAVQQGLIQFFHFLAGFLQALHKNLNCRGHTRIGRRFCHHGIIFKTINITESGDRR
ncbi:hypothetical protein D3C81_2177590 [compost metagenome]